MVDTREPKTLDEKLEAVGFEVYRQTLLTGDFLWVTGDGRSVGVERKTVNDLLSSLRDKQANGHNRFQNQMERMVHSFDVPLLLIEGKLTATHDGFAISDGRHTGWNWDSLDNIFLSLQRAGIGVVHAPKNRVPQRLVTVKNYFDKPTHLLISGVNRSKVESPGADRKDQQAA